MEKLVLKGKKEIRLLLVESLHQTVHTLGINKSKKKTEKVINKAAKRIAERVADQMKKEIKKIKSVKEQKPKTIVAKKVKKEKKIIEPELEIA